MIRQDKSGFRPNIAIPPGETLQEYLDSLSMKQVDLAKRAGLTTKTINEIIKGKAPITPETALKLESILGTPASFWNNLEGNYQETRARIQAARDIEDEVDIAGLIPYTELAKHGFVNKSRKPQEKVTNLRAFFGVASLHYVPEVLSVAFRKQDKDASSHYALASWIRMGEIMAGDIETESYSEKKVKSSIPLFRKLTVGEDSAFLPILERLCASCGIAFVMVPHLPKTFAQGATKWLNTGKAMIQLSKRYHSADVFWFSFFHELGHILLHSRKEAFVELGDRTDFEEEADDFSADCLIPRTSYKKFVEINQFSSDSIIRFAEKVGIDPGVVVGRLQHEKRLGYHCFQDLRKKLR